MSNFLAALSAVLPFFVFMALGYVINRVSHVGEEVTGKMNNIVFRYFYPVMMFSSLYKLDSASPGSFKLLFFCVAAVLILIVILMMTVPRIVEKDSRKGVVIQAVYRSNAILFALPLVQNVYGDDGAALAALVLAFVVPVYNVAAVIILEYFRGGRKEIRELAAGILKNPIIIGALAAAAVLILRIHFPAVIDDVIGDIASLTSPLALLILGMSLRFGGMRKNARALINCLLLKLLAVPAAVLLISRLFGFGKLETFIILAIFGTPVALATYTMSFNMEGDAEFAGQIVFLSTAVSVFTLFLWIYFLKSMGAV